MKDCEFNSKLLNNKKQKNTISIIPIIILLAFLFAIFFFKATYQRIYVIGASMENTLYGADNPYSPGGDYVYVFDAKPQRGDIVVIRHESKAVIKRVIGVGGDKVKITRGKVYLNDKLLDESYVSANKNLPFDFPETIVEKGYVYVLGDNRIISEDSRKYGPLPEEDLIGVVAEWSLNYKGFITAVNTFFEFTLPSWFGVK